MRIWFVTIGEPWPTDGEHPRLLRSGINAAYFTEQGHEVVFFNSTFDHLAKRERASHDVQIDIQKNYRLIGLAGGTYDRNISIQRIAYHRRVAKHFRSRSRLLEAPNAVVVSLTPLELAREAVAYGTRNNVPVVVDVRDMWPDIWADYLPRILRPAKYVFLAPFYRDLKRAISGATGIIGITDSAVDWALESAGRVRGPLDQEFPLAYMMKGPSRHKVDAAKRWWFDQGVTSNPNEMIGCFFGTLSSRVDLRTPLEAQKRSLDRRVKLIICGLGEERGLIEDFARDCSQIIYPGWVDAAQIQALMELSSFGLLPYRPTFDFSRSLPNKVFEYLSGGLPIVTSLRGEIERLFDKFNCGRLYDVDSPASFQSVMASLLSSRDELSKLAAGARTASANYDPLSACRSFEVYMQMIARPDDQFRLRSASRPRLGRSL